MNPLSNCFHLHVLGYQIDGNSVLSSPRNDHICVFLCREAELLKGGLYQGCVLRREDHQLRLVIFDLWWKMFLYSLLQHLVKNMFQIPSPVSDISHHSPARVQVNSKQFSGSNKSHLTWLPCQSCVSISVNEELEMEKVPHPWKVED